MALGDNNHPFFRPLWRRVLLVAFCAGWALVELLVVGDSTWAIMIGIVAAYAAWTFLITYQTAPAEPARKD
ncbi:hypothetical protein [Aureimonas jatrophae]|uniref:DUF3329 domain-containing protein n=1 Tax=Aureimonas jatrophae TaxID=1166073 RepID=A0A1H0D8K0_9HYPH|nr:hypothetical protein [Aureimonas jatrophae]MBB3951760.1 type II secretory pathway pseudopilin PulG [Aureimonas jatrophae]SDN66522.1 hypothetical protein SAMN05192530_101652 [Aureimonas jatrophae]